MLWTDSLHAKKRRENRGRERGSEGGGERERERERASERGSGKRAHHQGGHRRGRLCERGGGGRGGGSEAYRRVLRARARRTREREGPPRFCCPPGGSVRVANARNVGLDDVDLGHLLLHVRGEPDLAERALFREHELRGRTAGRCMCQSEGSGGPRGKRVGALETARDGASRATIPREEGAPASRTWRRRKVRSTRATEGLVASRRAVRWKAGPASKATAVAQGSELPRSLPPGRRFVARS
jgi:hypothetical protein